MVLVKKEGIILESTDKEFENKAVLNPACIKEGNTVHMFYRAVKEGNYSSIGYCKLKGPLKIVERSEKPILFPEFDYEKQGLEDPRIVFLNGIYYLFYTAYDGKNASAAYAISKDLRHWEKKGIITPKMSYGEAEDIFCECKLKQKYSLFESFYKDVISKDVLLWEKDVYLLPKKINGKFALFHRILPDIQIAYFSDFSELTAEYWKKYLKRLSDYVVLESKYWYESRNIGGGCPPIETDKGWLLIYHAVEDSNGGKRYHAGAALLDINNPCKVLGHLRKPLFSPEEEWEIRGDVKNVVFPTGTAIFGDRLYIYYGAADKRIAVASVNLNELLDEITGERCDANYQSEIGFTAGQIYNAGLKKEITLTQLKGILKKDEKVILMAVGWLAREGKVNFSVDNNDLKMRINE